jgi:carbon storage regulator
MLILSRRPGDAILIDGGIRIVVLSADPRVVRIGIVAPSMIGIVREEIVGPVADENRRATTTTAGREWLEKIAGTPADS